MGGVESLKGIVVRLLRERVEEDWRVGVRGSWLAVGGGDWGVDSVVNVSEACVFCEKLSFIFGTQE